MVLDSLWYRVPQTDSRMILGNCFGPYSRSIRNMYLTQILTNGRPYHSAISQAGFQVTMGRVKIVLFALVSSDPFPLAFSKGQPSKLLR